MIKRSKKLKNRDNCFEANFFLSLKNVTRKSHLKRPGTSSIWHRGTQKRAIFAYKSTEELSEKIFFAIIF
jgi:hypothetical protein